jgi:hypothetical protein
MKELLRTNDVALLSYLEALLTEKSIAYQIADVHMSVLDGSIGILPRRVLVAEEDYRTARQIAEAAQIELPEERAN